MNHVTRWLAGMALLGTIATAFAQGSQGGQGGFGGGPGTDFARMEGVETQLFRMILTPSDRCEWLIEARPNDVWHIEVTSQIFDPAVEIQTEKGEKIAENDDVAPGDQRAMLLTRLPGPGKYKIIVRNYKNSAGGALDMRLSRFQAGEAKSAGPSTFGEPAAFRWIAVPLSKDQDRIAVFRARQAGLACGFMGPGPLQRGYQESAAMIEQGTGFMRCWFARGEGFMYVMVPTPRPLTVDVQELPEKPAAIDGDAISMTLGDGLYALVHFEAKPHEIVRVDVESKDPVLTVDQAGVIRRDGGLEAWRSPADERTLYFRSREAGKRSLLVKASQPGAQVKVRLSSMRDSISGQGGLKLQAGKRGYFIYRITGAEGKMTKFTVRSTGVSATLGALLPSGGSGIFNGASADKVIVRASPGAPTYLMVTTAGAGALEIVAEEMRPRALQPGALSQGTVPPAGFEQWLVRGKAGQDVLLKVASDEMYWRIEVLADDGREIGSLTALAADPDDALRMRLPRDGDYIVIVKSTGGMGNKYRLKWFNLDM